MDSSSKVPAHMVPPGFEAAKTSKVKERHKKTLEAIFLLHLSIGSIESHRQANEEISKKKTRMVFYSTIRLTQTDIDLLDSKNYILGQLVEAKIASLQLKKIRVIS